MMKAIVHAKAVLPAGVVENCTILFENGQLLAAEAG